MLLRDSEPKAVRAAVHSSLLRSVEYVGDQTLVLTFRSGATYRYLAVPGAVVEELIAAESKGATTPPPATRRSSRRFRACPVVA
jgi:hypothetical protein